MDEFKGINETLPPPMPRNVIKAVDDTLPPPMPKYTDAACFEYKDKGNGVTITKYNGKFKEVKIPKQFNGKPVTEIGERAFYKCKNMTGVTIPEGVVRIEKMAFYGCVSLKHMTIPKSITSIGMRAFAKCERIEGGFWGGTGFNPYFRSFNAHYGGSKEQWKRLNGGAFNISGLPSSATIDYNRSSPD